MNSVSLQLLASELEFKKEETLTSFIEITKSGDTSDFVDGSYCLISRVFFDTPSKSEYCFSNV
jgi:hypothetical protein